VLVWANDNLAAVVPILVAVGTGIGILIQRKISGQAHVEDQESIERAIRLHNLLKTENMTLQEAKSLRDRFRRQRGGIVRAEADAIVTMTADAIKREPKIENADADFDKPIPYEHTTAGMRLKAAEELAMLEAQLSYAVSEFAHDCSEARASALYAAQDAWELFRDADSEVAGLLWEGGTGAPLLAIGRRIELTEQRIKDIRLAQAEAKL